MTGETVTPEPVETPSAISPETGAQRKEKEPEPMGPNDILIPEGVAYFGGRNLYDVMGQGRSGMTWGHELRKEGLCISLFPQRPGITADQQQEVKKRVELAITRDIEEQQKRVR